MKITKLKLIEDDDNNNLDWEIIKPPSWFERLHHTVRSTILAILYFALGFVAGQTVKLWMVGS